MTEKDSSGKESGKGKLAAAEFSPFGFFSASDVRLLMQDVVVCDNRLLNGYGRAAPAKGCSCLLRAEIGKKGGYSTLRLRHVKGRVAVSIASFLRFLRAPDPVLAWSLKVFGFLSSGPLITIYPKRSGLYKAAFESFLLLPQNMKMRECGLTGLDYADVFCWSGHREEKAHFGFDAVNAPTFELLVEKYVQLLQKYSASGSAGCLQILFIMPGFGSLKMVEQLVFLADKENQECVALQTYAPTKVGSVFYAGIFRDISLKL